MKSEEFIREVDEELRHDRLMLLWRRYGNLVIGAAIAIVVGTAAMVGFQNWQQRDRKAEALEFAKADTQLASGSYKEASAAFATLAADGSTGYAQLARLRQANALIKDGDQAGAEQALQALADDSGGDPLLRQAAALLLVSTQIDKADPAELETRLQPLIAAGAPYRWTARELAAVVALRKADEAKAKSLLDELSKDVGTTPQQKQRVDEMLQMLGGMPTPASS